MSRSNPWPLQAKLSVCGLALVLVAVAAVAGRHDSVPSTAATAGTDDSVTSSAATVVTTPVPTAAPTTMIAVTAAPTSRPKPTAPKPIRYPPHGPTDVLAGLPTGSLDTSHPYRRTADFGSAWTDNNDDPGGRNGCDTRDDILRRDLTAIVTRPGTNGCVVIAGQLADRYTGGILTFAKSQATAIQIDHVVPLHDAWELGAWVWPLRERVDYANDPVVLLAVSGPENERKSDKLADGWRPPNTAEWCDYASRTVTIHAKYRLPVTATERAALVVMLGHC